MAREDARFRGDTYTALVIGSSNFTCAGMGVASHRNAEANLVTVAERAVSRREAETSKRYGLRWKPGRRSGRG